MSQSSQPQLMIQIQATRSRRIIEISALTLASIGAVVSFFYFSLGVCLICMGLSVITQVQMSQISDLKIMIHSTINEKFEAALQQLVQGKDAQSTDDSNSV